MAVELKVPEVGESITEVFIGEWLKSEGDTVEKDEALVEVETDKATLEVPASVGGTLTKVLKKQGDTAEVGEVIAHIAEEGEDTGAEEDSEASAEEAQASSDEDNEGEEVEAESDESDEQAEASEVSDQDSEAGVSPEQDVEEGEPEKRGYESDEQETSDSEGEPRIMPAAQRLLEENGISADQVEATGPGGRLLKEDVQKYLDQQGDKKQDQKKETQNQQKEAPKQEKKEAPAQSSGDREEEAVAMSPLRRRIAERLVEAQQNAALLTTFNEIDMSEVMALRNEYKEAFTERYEGVRLGFMSFFVKAVIDALEAVSAAQRRDSRHRHHL